MSHSPILSVSQDSSQYSYLSYLLEDIIKDNTDAVGLYTRNTKIIADVILLSKLPHSLLSAMFPNGARNYVDSNLLGEQVSAPIYIKSSPISFASKYNGVYLAVPLEPEYLLYALNYYNDLLKDSNKKAFEQKYTSLKPEARTSIETNDSQVLYIDASSSNAIKSPDSSTDNQMKQTPDKKISSKEKQSHNIYSQLSTKSDSDQHTNSSFLLAESDEDNNDSAKKSDNSAFNDSNFLNLDLGASVDLQQSLDIVDIDDIGDLDSLNENNLDQVADEIYSADTYNENAKNFYDSAEFYYNESIANLSCSNFLSKATTIVILKEELDYFIVPKSFRTIGDIGQVYGYDLNMAKSDTGKILASEKNIFGSILSYIEKITPPSDQKETDSNDQDHKYNNASQPNNAYNFYEDIENLDHIAKVNHITPGLIEKQLVDMLCSCGFDLNSEWASRIITSDRTSICSISLVTIDKSETNMDSKTAKQLFGFFRKPAIKCWWDSKEISLNKDKSCNVELFCRRTWTLEISLI
ncbi:hypothetical protein BB561_005917 [Smittium simulii]|uniref:Uncharacterized protein n=1 Tax=Smittium simulii TaxID=133385 RepID=A0A2T9Y7P6_9FUNG|nr:hypothetical protein BB561_005917 [Smittium simulii]